MKFTILLSCRHMHHGAKNLMCVMLLFVIGSPYATNDAQPKDCFTIGHPNQHLL